MSKEQKKYKSCPDCIDKGKMPSGETRDGIYLECSTCDGTGNIEQPQEGKPLTAEEISATISDYVLQKGNPIMRTDGGYYHYSQVVSLIGRYTAALREELEAVKKERDSLRNAIIRGDRLSDSLSWEGDGPSIKQQLSEVTRQRDEAVDTLKEIDEAIDYVGASNVPATIVDISIKKIAPLRFRLSSGETKPASPWISVEERLPDKGQSVAFVVDLPGDYRHGKVYGGKFTGHDFATPGIGQPASHWMPLPAPPESSTVKTTCVEAGNYDRKP